MAYSGNPIDDWHDECHSRALRYKMLPFECDSCNEKFDHDEGGLRQPESRKYFCPDCIQSFLHVHYLRDMYIKEGLRIREIAYIVDNLEPI